MAESINFNRAATFYDATRALPSDLAEGITKALLSEIRAVGADRVLEVGIGTGRMARPLMREGVHFVGVDISTEMMGQLIAQLTPAHTQPELMLGDATALPFRDGAFKAAMVVHVLHLVASVENTIAEIRRVLTPGGVLLQQFRRPDEETLQAWKDHDVFWDAFTERHGFSRRKRKEATEIGRMLEAAGGTLSVIEIAREDPGSSVGQEIDNIRNRRHSWMWEIPEEILDAGLPEYETLLRERAGADGRFFDHVTQVIEVCRW